MDRFRGAVAIVTGGASGLGRALCEELGRRGAIVVVADVDEPGARAVAAGIEATGGWASAARLDVRDAAAVAALVQGTAAAHGRLDLMINNAGVAVMGEAQDLDLDHWRRVVDVNLWGVIHGATAAYGVMARQGSGHIVNVASLAGLAGFPTASPYATTKFAVVGLSQSLRAEGEDLGVKVSVVCPGFVQTAIFDNGAYVGSRKEDALAQVRFKMIDAGRAARLTLDGIARNRAFIVFPLYARLLWRLLRLSPGMAVPIHRMTVRGFRASRRASGRAETV